MISHSETEVVGEENPYRGLKAGLGTQKFMEDEYSSPRGVLEATDLGTDSDRSRSSSCRTPFLDKSVDESDVVAEEVEEETRRHMQWWNLVDVLKRKSARKLSGIQSRMSGYEHSRRRLKKKLFRHRCGDGVDAIVGREAVLAPKPSWRSFNCQELAAATDNFSPENFIGKGGHAEVYRGRLTDGQLVAVKRLNKEEVDEQRTTDFLSELGIIAHINHPNAARLVGFSSDGGLHIVLQLAPHGSLASVLHGPTESLPWNVRFKVAVGVAEGLQYLHHNCPRRIIHRDIKASNVLLTEDYEPQISDFGLAKWLPDEWTHHVIFPIEGTLGYLSPEYFMHGIANEKSDVFAFGVLLLELITGRHAIDSSGQSLVMWAKPLLDTNKVDELVDPRLNNNYEPTEMKQAVTTALMCIRHLSTRRPDMIRVVQLLKGKGRPAETNQKSVGGRALLLDSCDVESYTSSTYLKDLNRHMELVLE